MNHHVDQENQLLQDVLLYSELFISLGIFAARSIVHIKMSMYLQTLEDKHRWEMITAQGSATIAATIIFASKLAMD